MTDDAEDGGMSRLAWISRYQEKALDRAALVAALGSVRMEEHELTPLRDRQEAQLLEHLHDFAFVARKFAEGVVRERFHSAEYVKAPHLMCGREDGDDFLGIEFFSLWDVLGRLIHSDRFSVTWAAVADKHGNLPAAKSAWGFRVASDWDRPGTNLFVYIEFLLVEFMRFAERAAIDLRRAEGLAFVKMVRNAPPESLRTSTLTINLGDLPSSAELDP